jgi:predicted dehydrogenase
MSQKFVTDLLVHRPDAKARHEIVAIGSSSISKAEKFVADVITPSQTARPSPRLYDNYQGVYEDTDVDVVYVGTPHSLHRQNCLDAIERGKNVLCEKPFAINAREVEEVVDSARQKGVYVMEGEDPFPFLNLLPVMISVFLLGEIGEEEKRERYGWC